MQSNLLLSYLLNPRGYSQMTHKVFFDNGFDTRSAQGGGCRCLCTFGASCLEVNFPRCRNSGQDAGPFVASIRILFIVMSLMNFFLMS